jgi:hypothetical protein
VVGLQAGDLDIALGLGTGQCDQLPQPPVNRGSPAADLHQKGCSGPLCCGLVGHRLGNGRGQPLTCIPGTGLVADPTLPAAHPDPELGPAEAGPLGQLGAFVEHSPGGRQIPELLVQPGEFLQRPGLDLEVADAGCPRSTFRVERTGIGRIGIILDATQGHQGVGLVINAADGAGNRQGLLAPTPGLLWPSDIDQRLRHGSGDSPPQPGRRLRAHQRDRPGLGAQRLLDMAGVEEIAPTALMGSRRPGGIGGHLGDRGGIVG